METSGPAPAASVRAAVRPAKPPPMTTIRVRDLACRGGGSTTARSLPAAFRADPCVRAGRHGAGKGLPRAGSSGLSRRGAERAGASGEGTARRLAADATRASGTGNLRRACLGGSPKHAFVCARVQTSTAGGGCRPHASERSRPARCIALAHAGEGPRDRPRRNRGVPRQNVENALVSGWSARARGHAAARAPARRCRRRPPASLAHSIR